MDRLHAQPHGWARPAHERRGRARSSQRCLGADVLALRRLQVRRRQRRLHLVLDRHRQVEGRRSAGLARLRPSPQRLHGCWTFCHGIGYHRNANSLHDRSLCRMLTLHQEMLRPHSSLLKRGRCQIAMTLIHREARSEIAHILQTAVSGCVPTASPARTPG